MKLTTLLMGAVFFLAACSQNTQNTPKETYQEPADYVFDLNQQVIDHLGLVISENAISFGETTAASASSTKIVQLKNTMGGGVIPGIVVAGEGYSIKYNRCPSTIAPNTSCSIALSFSNRGMYNAASASGSLIISVNDQPVSIPLSASVSGKVNPSTKAAILSHALSPFNAGTGPTRELTISNASSGGVASNIQVSLPTGYGIWLNRCPSTLNPGKSCIVTILYKGHRSGSPVAGSMTVSSDSATAMGQSVSINILSGVVGSGNPGGGDPDPEDPPANFTTQASLTVSEKIIDTFPNSVSAEFYPASGTQLHPQGMYEEQGQATVRITCAPGMETSNFEVYLANYGLESINAGSAMQIASGDCNQDLIASKYLQSPDSNYRRIYNEPMYLFVQQRDVEGNILYQKVVSSPGTQLFATPPKFSASSLVRFQYSGSYYIADNSGSVSLDEGYSGADYSGADIQSLYNWTSCSGWVNGPGQNIICYDNMGYSGMGISRLEIRDEFRNITCGEYQGVMSLTLCSSFSAMDQDAYCTTSEMTYQASCPTDLCSEDQEFDPGSNSCVAKCSSMDGLTWSSVDQACVSVCMSGEEWTGASCSSVCTNNNEEWSEIDNSCVCSSGTVDYGSGCESEVYCSDFGYDQCENNSYGLACTWNPMDQDFPEMGGDCN